MPEGKLNHLRTSNFSCAVGIVGAPVYWLQYGMLCKGAYIKLSNTICNVMPKITDRAMALAEKFCFHLNGFDSLGKYLSSSNIMPTNTMASIAPPIMD
ncbi:hypothetical protein SDC9_89195 [bioreactor metagenome]|uniref:Uncharacterized protein n=1 Tax=bioreactor metagenome TaxID=1076179 RepID=A0A644ZNJ5_9ZZZZ